VRLPALALLVFAGFTLAPRPGRAEARASYLITGGTSEARRAADGPARAFLAERGVTAGELGATEAVEDPVPEARLSVLANAERALLEARQLAARFEEARALLVLTEAEAALGEALDVPLAHAYLAEVEVQLALVAAALGESALAATALERAATLDPQRSLQAAEAPPEVLELARRIEQARDGAPRSHTRVEAEPRGARVILDGQAIGSAPLELSVAPGRHALLVRAPGHVAYAALVELGAGQRAPLRIALSESPREVAKASLLAVADDAAAARTRAAALGALGADELWLFELDAERATSHVSLCDAAGCSARGTITWRDGTPARRAREEPRDKPRWRRWPFWLGVTTGVVAAGTALAIGLAHDEHTRKERMLTIDPGSPPAAN
jgi:hypothetical protein